jgi:hypothetical protein
MEDNNTLKNIAFYVPAMLNITGKEDFGWGRIDRLINDKWADLTLQANGEMINVEASYFLTMVAASKGNPNAIGLLHFLNNVFKDLSEILCSIERELVRSNIKNMLTAFDLRFYDFAGEIAVLNNLMRTGIYKLKGVEHAMSNNKKADFLLESVEDKSLIHIEIFNIHVDSDKVIDDPKQIEDFLVRRLLNKISEKGKDLKEGTLIQLIPVIWGISNDLEIYSRHFKKNKLPLKNVTEPHAWLMKTDGKGFYKHDFARISRLSFDAEIWDCLPRILEKN